MRNSTKNTQTTDKSELRESILRSMIASFKIEKINISEKTAQEIYRRVSKRLKKVA
jgi:ribosomal protein L17